MSFSLLLPYRSIIYAAWRISLNFNPSSPAPIATALAFLISDVTNQSSCAHPLSSTKSESFHVIPLLRDVLWLAGAVTIKSSISKRLSRSLLVLPPIVILPVISWSSWKTTTAAPPSQPSTDMSTATFPNFCFYACCPHCLQFLLCHLSRRGHTFEGPQTESGQLSILPGWRRFVKGRMCILRWRLLSAAHPEALHIWQLHTFMFIWVGSFNTHLSWSFTRLLPHQDSIHNPKIALITLFRN